MRLLHRVYLTTGLLVAAIFLIDLPVVGAVVNVPQDYATLRMAVDSVSPGDTILLDSGTYSGEGFSDITISKALTIKSMYGASTTTIRGTASGLSIIVPIPTFASIFIMDLTLSGFGYAVRYDGYGHLEMRRCVLHANGYGVYTDPSFAGEVVVDSCNFISNGVGLYQYVETYADIHHSFFRGNGTAFWCYSCWGGLFSENILIDNLDGLSLDGGAPWLQNNLIWRNDCGVRLQGLIYSWPYFEHDFKCNDVFGNTTQYGGVPNLTGTFGNISEDPQFCDTTLANLSVSSFSPLLAANNSCHVNIGGVSTIGCYCGDVDKSSGLDIADLTLLIGYLYLGEPAPSPIEAGRIDGDASVDISDVTYLITYLFLSGPKPICS